MRIDRRSLGGPASGSEPAMGRQQRLNDIVAEYD
jgi:hypothetical protein